MAPFRSGHRMTADADKDPDDSSVKKSSHQTPRRWQQQGKLNEKNLPIYERHRNWQKDAPAHLCKPSNAEYPPQDDIQADQIQNEVETVVEYDSYSLKGENREVDHMSNAHSESFSDEINSENVSLESSCTVSESDVSQFDDNTNGCEVDYDEDLPDLSQISSMKSIERDILNELLHPSLRVTKFETMMLIMHLAIKYGMSGEFFEDILAIFNKVVGIPDALLSKHLFPKLTLAGYPFRINFYCPNCKVYLGNEFEYSNGVIDCKGCDWTSSVSSHNGDHYFISLSIKDQIKNVLTRSDIKFVCKDRQDNVVSDIMDGTMYKVYGREGNILSNPNALTLTMNIGGSPVFKSGPNSLWPVHFLINEIEPDLRYELDNILLAGLWFGKTEVDAQIFLKPLVEQLQELEKGFEWTKPDGNIIEVPVYLLSCCCDSISRPKVQHLNQLHESYACGICLHPVTLFEKVDSYSSMVGDNYESAEENDTDPELVHCHKKIMRYQRGEYEIRTNLSLREHMKLAAASDINDHIMGATGVSVLCDLRHFNVVHGFVIDYCHNVILGTVKTLAGLWFDSCNKGSDYYIGFSDRCINSRLEQISTPKGIQPPRPISQRCDWEADEWRAFLLYFSLPVLSNILPTPYYNHFKKLVISVHTLTRDSMLHDEVNDAHRLLQEFVYEYQDLYGVINMVYDVHITSHLAQAVSKMGPLWAYSAFPFQSANDRLINLANEGKGDAGQLALKYLMTKNVSILLRSDCTINKDLLNLCSNLVGFRYLENSGKGENGLRLFREEIYITLLDDGQKQAFESKGFSVPHKVRVACRAVVRGKLILGRLSIEQRRKCDSCVRLTSGDFALVDLIIPSYQENTDLFADVFFIITKLNMATDPSPYLVSHIKQCSLNPFGDIEVIRPEEISRKCMFYLCADSYFVSELTNFYETD